MKRIIIPIILLITVSAVIGITYLSNNKTFFKETYVGASGQEFFVPKYSYFKQESGNIVATFNSLKSEKELNEEINNYMKGFEYFEESGTSGYRKGGLIIQKYEVVNYGLYRKIFLTY